MLVISVREEEDDQQLIDEKIFNFFMNENYENEFLNNFLTEENLYNIKKNISFHLLFSRSIRSINKQLSKPFMKIHNGKIYILAYINENFKFTVIDNVISNNDTIYDGFLIGLKNILKKLKIKY